MIYRLVLLSLLVIFISCDSSKERKVAFNKSDFQEVDVKYAVNFSLERNGDQWLIHVNKPYQNAKEGFTYLVTDRQVAITKKDSIDEVIYQHVDSLICTSTTHIPSLNNLNILDKLIGFPGTDMISTPEARAKIKKGQVMELGNNGRLNTEKVISLQPDVVVGFSVSAGNETLDKISSFGIPVMYNADWLEKHPLGKAEWIKFFGVLTGKYEEAQTFFDQIESNYNQFKSKAKEAKTSPRVIAGAMLNDQWYLPYGSSWQAQFIKDANADYVYAYTEGKGSISLSFEKVFKKAKDAAYWVAPAQYSSYQSMKEDNRHYAEFKAFQDKNIYGFASTKGETGGILYYEQAPNRPDLVLKDLINIFHPELINNYSNNFFKPLQ